VIAEDGRGASSRPARGSRPAAAPPPPAFEDEEDVLELNDPIDEGAGLVSADAAEASRQALAALSTVRESALAGGDGPLEAVVREMLRPMLKEWLDARLPDMVEALVTREIARITGKDY
jgi:cell pole-organizing protein PopZ